MYMYSTDIIMRLCFIIGVYNSKTTQIA